MFDNGEFVLCELMVKNLALIEELSLSFGPGANIITGETGAGKSIVVGALSLLLGRKAGPNIVRAEADEASVSALFNIDKISPELLTALTEAGFAETNELILKRIITSQGRSRAYLNGAPLTLGQLASIGAALLTISGQHEQQALLKSSMQLDFLDSFGHHQKDLSQLKEAWQKREEAKTALKALEDELREAEEKRDLFEFQQAEITKAGPVPDEDDALWEERNKIKNQGSLSKFISDSLEILSNEKESVLDKLDKVKRLVEKAAEFESDLNPSLDHLEESYHLLADVAQKLERIKKEEVDPDRLEWVDERLNVLTKLKRKYGPTLADVIERLGAITSILDRLDGAGLDLAQLRRQQAEAAQLVLKRADLLHNLRLKSAEKLTQVLVESLKPLGFARLTMEIELKGEGGDGLAIGPKGYDQAEFLFCPNPGEGLRPLAQIASGGELSRVMLALRTAQASYENDSDLRLLVFDEIDSGLGGGTAEAVAGRMRDLAAQQQVIVITHLAQMAALAGQHFLVAKEPDDQRGRTVTSLALLNAEGREHELARMVGGATPGPEALALAQKLLRQYA